MHRHPLPFAVIVVVFVAASSRGQEREVARQEDERIVREAGVTPDAAGLLAFFRKRTLDDNDLKTIEQQVRDLGDKSFARRQEASRKLVERGPSVVQYLKPALLNSDLEMARRANRCMQEILLGPGPGLSCAAARVLARLDSPDAMAVLVAYLPFGDDETVQEEVLESLAHLARDPARAVPLTKLLADSSTIKRIAAGYVLGRSTDKVHQASARKLLADAEASVRLWTCHGLLAGRDKAGVPALIDLLTNPSQDLSYQAENLLLRVGGDNAPAAPADASEKARKEYRDRWAAWWEANANKVDLASFDQEPPQRGWTVIAQMSTSRVYEIDRRGQVRWTVDGLQGPIDVQFLGGDRILVAEHHGSRVSERNLQGNVLWDKKLDDRPVSAQRLSNGNTFITTYSSMMEVTRDGREVYSHQPEGTKGQLYCGHRMRNGRIVCVTLSGKIIEMDPVNGKVLKTLNSGLNGCYGIQGLPGGHYLLASYNEGKVHELDESGKVVWRFDLASSYHAERLPNGNTLISSHGMSKVVEVDRKGKVVSEQGTTGQNVWRVHRR